MWRRRQRTTTLRLGRGLPPRYRRRLRPLVADPPQHHQIAGTRWAVEECFQTAKTEIGLDHHQVRRYDAWYRHITLVLCAHAYLAVTAAHAKKGAPNPTTASSLSPSARSAVCWHT
ncbi:transposase [Micromonospora sp. NPDC005174]|uniref:transposase n=1 Tax=Micromonospora sp. NPDC005174 TaxID=3157018 RepID=UPI0033BEB22D